MSLEGLRIKRKVRKHHRYARIVKFVIRFSLANPYGESA